jgi:hypothetical protein
MTLPAVHYRFCTVRHVITTAGVVSVKEGHTIYSPLIQLLVWEADL